MDRLYVVSMFRDKVAANRRQTWLDPKVLRRAIHGSATAQRQVVLNVANAFRKPPETIEWSTLKFTILPLSGDAHFLDNL